MDGIMGPDIVIVAKREERRGVEQTDRIMAPDIVLALSLPL